MDQCQERRRPPEVKGYWGLKRVMWDTFSSHLLPVDSLCCFLSFIHFLFLLCPPPLLSLFSFSSCSIKPFSISCVKRVNDIWRATLMSCTTLKPSSSTVLMWNNRDVCHPPFHWETRIQRRSSQNDHFIQHHWRTLVSCIINNKLMQHE